MPIKTTDNDAKYRRFRQALKRAGRDPHVTVGVHRDAPDHVDENGDKKSMVMIASVHEFGAPSVGVPMRSYLRSTFDERRAEYIRVTKRIMNAMIDGRMTMDQGLMIMAQKAESDVKKKITDINTPKLKKATVDRKGSSNPLIDTGQLRASIRGKAVG